MHKVKITVLRTSVNRDLVELHVDRERARTLGPCDVLKEGQEFVTDVIGGMPEGFCAWAWADLYKVLVAYMAGGDFGEWTHEDGTMIACCTDGERPVYFKLEKLPADG
jgi:uncharacterized repeat protein (TIGR04076 family)